MDNNIMLLKTELEQKIISYEQKNGDLTNFVLKQNSSILHKMQVREDYSQAYTSAYCASPDFIFPDLECLEMYEKELAKVDRND